MCWKVLKVFKALYPFASGSLACLPMAGILTLVENCILNPHNFITLSVSLCKLGSSRLSIPSSNSIRVKARNQREISFLFTRMINLERTLSEMGNAS